MFGRTVKSFMYNSGMETARVTKLDGKTVLETTTTATVKKQVTESRLLEQKTYFETMVRKGQAGLEAVNAKLTTIQNERAKAA